MYLDGVASETLNQQGDNRTVALNVDVDSVDQFQVITSVPPAEYMGAGAENYTMKSGSAAVPRRRARPHSQHRLRYLHLLPEAGNRHQHLPPPSIARRRQTPAGTQGVQHTDEFSAYGGGFIPHTGKKLFFFLAYDKFHGRSGISVNFTTIPTALEEQGDFTELNPSNVNTLTAGGFTGVVREPLGRRPTSPSCTIPCPTLAPEAPAPGLLFKA